MWGLSIGTFKNAALLELAGFCWPYPHNMTGFDHFYVKSF